MTRTRFPLGPLWVLIGFFWLVSLFEPVAGKWNMSPIGAPLPTEMLGDFLAAMMRGVVLSQFLLLAVWLTLTKGSGHLRILGVTGVGLLSLLFWTSTSWNAWEQRSYPIGQYQLGGEWSLVVLTLAPFLLLALILFTSMVGRQFLGYRLAGPANFRPVSRGARLTALWLSGVLVTLVLLITFARLALEPRFLLSLGDVWFEDRWALKLQDYMLPLAALVVTPFTGLPWLALVIDAPRRPLWWVLALTVSACAVAASMLLAGSWTTGIAFAVVQMGQVLGILGTLGLLAACGWQWDEQETEEEQAFDQATAAEPTLADLIGDKTSPVRGGWLRENRILVLLLFVWPVLWLIDSWLFSTVYIALVPTALIAGVTSSFTVLLAVWAVFSSAPLRLRVPAVALAFVAERALQMLSERIFREYLMEYYTLLSMLTATLHFGVFLAVCGLLRVAGGLRIVRSAPPAGDASQPLPNSAAHRGQQFGVRDLMFWTAGVAVIITLCQLLLPRSDFTRENLTEQLLYIPLWSLALLPSLLWVGAVLHYGRRGGRGWGLRWVWALIWVVAVLPGTFLVTIGISAILTGNPPEPYLWMQIWPFQIGASFGVAATMALLATAGYRLEGRWARRLNAQTAAPLETVPTESTL